MSAVRARILATAALLLTAPACGDLQLHYVESGDASSPDASPDAAQRDATSFDGPPASAVDGSPIGDGGFCGCDLAAGQSCCLPAGGGAPFCTESTAACAGAGGIALGCGSSTNDSSCCWNGPLGPGGLTAFAALCGDRPLSCQTQADCPGMPCSVTTCSGLNVGVCGQAAPSCP